MARTLLMLIAIAALVAGCNHAPPPDAPVRQPGPGTAVDVQETEKGQVRVVEVAVDLEHPWGLAFLPDARMLVTERAGRLRIVQPDGRVSAPLAGLPDIFVDGQAGLLDVAVSPTFAEDGLVYFAFAEPSFRGNKAGTAVARARLTDTALEQVEVIYRQEPKLSSGTHVGSRLVFADDGNLFVTQGENRVAAAAQALDKLQGKLVRIRPDGSIPGDNPFVGRDDARPEIWSYGHRNMQGAAINPATRQLWTSEHGPMGGDELNIPQPGRNYGWPIVTSGVDYSGQPVPGSTGESAPGMEPPHHVWKKSPALSGMAFYDGKGLPQWRGNLFLGALVEANLIRLELDGDEIVHEERLLGARRERIRDVREGADGMLWLLTDEERGKLLRIEPGAVTPTRL